MPNVLATDRPFTTQQALASGVSRQRLTAMIRSKRLRRVLIGVYDAFDAPDTTDRRALAASLVVPPWAIACDRTAAWIHGVDAFDYRDLDVLPPLELCAIAGKHRVQRVEVVGIRRDLKPGDVMTVAGIRVTTPLRTALDLGAKLSRRAALAILDRFMREHGLTREDFRRELPRYRRRRGVVQLRELIQIADPRAESPPESWTRLDIIDADLPAPDLQVSVIVGGRELFRLDLAYPRLRIAVEYDGEEFHTLPDQISHDRARREWLAENGWVVIVVTKGSFAADARDAWLQRLRDVLQLRLGRRV